MWLSRSDGTQRITRMKYPGDYATGSGNPEAAALTAMQDVSSTGAHMPGVVIERTVNLVRRVADGRTVVLIEHNMKVVGSLADRVTVLQQGRVLVEGGYAEVRDDPRVVAAYLGEASAQHP